MFFLSFFSKSFLYPLFERKYKNWEGSYKNLEDIIKIENEHWKIAKVVNKNSNLIEISIINTDETIILNQNQNFYGPKKVSPNIYLNLNDYLL